jgi:hypothetical protein
LLDSTPLDNVFLQRSLHIEDPFPTRLDLMDSQVSSEQGLADIIANAFAHQVRLVQGMV